MAAVQEKIEKEYAEGKKLDKKARIVLTGCPIGGVTEKVIKAIENGKLVIKTDKGTFNVVGVQIK